MNFAKMLLWGGAAFLGYKLWKGTQVPGGAAAAVGVADPLTAIAGVYGMPQNAVAYYVTASGQLVVYDKRNNAPMMIVEGAGANAGAALTKAAMNATAAVAAAGNKAWPTTGYNAAAYPVA